MRIKSLQQQIEYRLPGDEMRVMSVGLATGYLAALQSFSAFALLDKETVEKQAIADYERLRFEAQKTGKTLTNDPSEFLACFKEHYVKVYQESQVKWELDRKRLRDDRAALKDVDPAVAWRMMYAHFYHLSRYIKDMEEEIRAKILAEIQASRETPA